MGTLVLVRHGQASFLAADYDHLSPVGEEQARRLGAHWAARGAGFDLAFTGPRRRQRGTADRCAEAVVAGGGSWPGHEVVDDLDEMRIEEGMKKVVPQLAHGEPSLRGLLEGIAGAADQATRGRLAEGLFRELSGRWIRGEISHPEIEPWPHFVGRIRGALKGLREAVGDRRGARVVVFTSGGPIGVAMQLALGLDDVTAFGVALGVRNGSISEFLFRDERFSLSTFNGTPHLDEPTLITYR